MYRPRSRYRRKLAAAAVTIASLAVTPIAIASTQPFSTDNPFETNDLPNIVNGTSSKTPPESPPLGQNIPNFPGIPGGAPTTPGGASGDTGDILGTVGDIYNGGDILGGIGNVLGGSQGGERVPSLFKDILNGNIDGILGSIFDILTSQNEIFDEVSKIVLGDGWEGAGGGEKGSTPDPYKVRLPQEGESDEATGIITRSPIVLRRDKANQYDQALGRAMAAPMLAEQGDKWLEAQITTSADMMQAGLTTTQSAILKSGEATEATSTQDIVRKSAEISGIAATMQMQEMQQNAMIGESLWNMQRLESAQLQLAANTSEAADEQNRRERANRSAALNSAAAEAMIIPGLADLSTPAANSAPAAPAASSLFASP